MPGEEVARRALGFSSDERTHLRYLQAYNNYVKSKSHGPSVRPAPITSAANFIVAISGRSDRPSTPAAVKFVAALSRERFSDSDKFARDIGYRDTEAKRREISPQSEFGFLRGASKRCR